MNQAIQFPEREWWDDVEEAVCFHAMVNGFLRICAISRGALLLRYGNSIDPLSTFMLNRWDLEEEAEERIKSNECDPQGWIWLY